MDQPRRRVAAERGEMPHVFAFGSSNINREWAHLRNKENFFCESGKFSVVSKLKCPVFLAREMSGFGFTTSNIYPAVGAVGMWESQAAFWPDFSKPLREATLFVAFRGGVISTASV